MQRYESYTPSGVKWLGDVPAHWEVRPGFTCFKENKDRNKGLVESTVLSLSYGRIVIKPEEKLTGLVPESFESYQLIKPGDIVIRTTDLQNDQTSLRVGYAKDKGMITSAYLGLRCYPEINPEYVFRLLESYDALKVFYGMGSGLRQNIDFWDFKRLPVPLPPRDEQDRIVTFLDQKTAEIDAAIAKKERLIELLEIQKRVLINRAVTQGLDHRVGVKKSGITWLGEVPAHWRLLPNKALFRERKELGKPDLSILSVSLHSGVSDQEQDETENIRAKIRIEDRTSYKRVFPGDVAYNMMRAWQGAIGVVRVDGQVSPAYVVAAPRAEIHGAYFEHLYRTEGFIREMDRFSKGITDFRKRLYWDEFKQLMTLLPPISEQIEIAGFVERIGHKTAQASASALAEIEKLRELRRVLVAQTVTGQVRV
jgi:type I restriction enzyme S subunit